MRCVKCRAEAQVEVRRHHAAFCGPHFLEWFEAQVERAVRRERMFGPQDRVLVAVSGGKDSLVLWDVLLRRGYRASGLHLNLGIGEYSQQSQEKCEAFARQRGAELLVVDIPSEYGVGVEGLAELAGRVACSACGLSKRYLFNRVARERGFDVVATAHNLDDEAAVLLGNLIAGNVDALVRQSPVLDSGHPGLVRKVKPLYRIAERETAAYAVLRGIDYVLDECPNSVGARSLLLKEALNLLERDAPGTKQSLYWNFLEKLRPLLRAASEPVALRSCLHCGQPTTAEVCAFCRMTERVAHKLRSRVVAPAQAGREPVGARSGPGPDPA
ncbi:MAG: TIGR00269 family protein [Armatimonadota bacterium]|nr:TIGR00269 family protein [Armatimonadota bacterium]MDR7411623.1 TIGR00269 family protein [Armatimonadota bacterium]MDR7425349.1 TIGR00269 family protein [Armatimonadota bacterium]